MQICVVVLPIGDLALQGTVDASGAGFHHSRSLIPQSILSGNGIQRGRVRLGICLCQRHDLLSGISDDSLQLLSLRCSLGLRLRLFLGCAGELFHRLLGALDLCLGGGHCLRIRINGLVEILNGSLSLVHLIPVYADGFFQLIIFASESGAVFTSLLRELIHPNQSGIPILLGSLQLDLRLGQLDAVLGGLRHNLAVLVIQGIDVLLVRLGLRILLPGFGVLA